MKFLFVMDPAETMLPDKDTSFAFLRAAGARGHQTLHAAPEDVGVHIDPDGRARVTARARPITVSEKAPHVTLGSPDAFAVDELDAVFIRKDPPFDVGYLHLTQVLDLVRDETLVLNDPRGLQGANEKLFALRFGKWMPKTLVTRDPERIHSFVEEVGGRAILKPLDGAGGSGVVSLVKGDTNARALVEMLTFEGKVPAMVQAFEPSITTGDKRVLLLEGRVLGVIRRIPRADDIRANIHVGGRVELASLSPDEETLVADLAPTLVQHGLHFVGLDLIGGKLIEVNVTSPTGIQQLGRLGGTTPEVEVISWVEETVRKRSSV